MSLSSPFATLTGDPWDLTPVGGKIVLSAKEEFPDDPRGRETTSWRDMFTRYSIEHPGRSASWIAFRAPSHGRFGVVNRDGDRLGVFLPLSLGPWAFASDGAVWPQPHGNALVMNWNHLAPSDVEERISMLVYQRLLDTDPIRYLSPVAGGAEDEYEVSQLISNMDDLLNEEGEVRRDVAKGVATETATVEDALKLLLPLTEGTLLPLKSANGDGVKIDLAAAHVETENGEILPGKPWTWVDVDAVFHYLSEADVFGPNLNFGTEMRDKYVRMWRENDDLSRDQRPFLVEVGFTQLYEPPKTGTVSEDILPIRERTDFFSTTGGADWFVKLINHRNGEVLDSTVEHPRPEPLTLYPQSEEGTGVAETSVRVGVESESGATYRNQPWGIQRVWMWGLGLSMDRASYDTWRGNVLGMNPTDFILIPPHTAINQIDPGDPSYDLEEGTLEDIAYIAQNLHENDIRPHIGLYIAPFERWLRDTGEQISQIVERVGSDDSGEPIVESVVFDLERPWNDPGSEHRFDIGDDDDPIQTPSLTEYRRLVDSVLLPSYRPVTEFGTVLRATEQGNVAAGPGDNGRRRRSETVFDACDKLFPQAYTSSTTEDEEEDDDEDEVEFIHSTNPGPHQERRIRQWANRYDKPLVPTLTLQNQAEIPGIRNEAVAIWLAVAACTRWTPHPVDGIAFWSMAQATGDKEDVVGEICQQARGAGVMGEP